MDDPEHFGEKKAWIETQEITYLNIRQQKTGAKVAIPCNSQLKAILEKYNYQVPTLQTRSSTATSRTSPKMQASLTWLRLKPRKAERPRKRRLRNTNSFTAIRPAAPVPR